MLQFVDPESVLRIDVFRANGATLSRSSNLDLPSGMIQLISLEDLAARMARLALDLVAEVSVPAKHAADILHLAELVDPTKAETAWLDHRRPGHPISYEESITLLQRLIPARPHLLMTPDYSRDAEVVCPRCRSMALFG